MTPGFSLRRMVFRRRYLHALVATAPHEAVTRCINYWASRWRSTPVETPGMREQLAQHGWVGTEIADGLDTLGGLFSTVTDAIARSDLFPHSASQPASQPAATARYQTSRILIAARPWSAEGRVASEVWCFDTRVSQRTPPPPRKTSATTSRTSPSRCSSMSYCSRSQNSSSRAIYQQTTSSRDGT